MFHQQIHEIYKVNAISNLFTLTTFCRKPYDAISSLNRIFKDIS